MAIRAFSTGFGFPYEVVAVAEVEALSELQGLLVKIASIQIKTTL